MRIKISMDIKDGIKGRKQREKGHRLLITVTDEEYKLLKRLSEATDSPMASEFLLVARDLGVFVFIRAILSVGEKLVSVVSPLKKTARKMINQLRSID